MGRGEWNLRIGLILMALAAQFCCPAATSAQSRSGDAPRPRLVTEPSPEQDDAALHAVCLLPSGVGYAVGDRGTVWKTSDNGESWQFIAVPTTESLRGVCFLTERLGWVVGGGTREFTQRPIGVLLRTIDGGANWEASPQTNLPRLTAVQFFDASSGVAIGETNDEFPTGVLTTDDGGESWTAAPGTGGAWTTGCFLNPETGILGGGQGRHGTFSRGMLNVGSSTSSLRGFHGAAVDASVEMAWLVGDGGQVLRSENTGTSWTTAGSTLPREVSLVFDFRGVAAERGRVWIAGAPGSVIWHSPDAGTNWLPQSTSETTPLNAISQVSDGRLVAVGDLGKILLSTDGGTRWKTVRGAHRKLAALAMHADGGRISFAQLSRDAGERGFRTGGWVLVRRDVGTANVSGDNQSQRFRDSAIAAGASAVTIDWRLPIAVPGLDRDAEMLEQDWGVLTDQRLDDVLAAVLAAQIRIWRPDVILLDEPPADDAPTQLLQQLLSRAVDEAASDKPGLFSRLWTVSRLPDWKVSRAFSRMPAGSSSPIQIDPFEWLASRNGTVATVSTAAASRLLGRTPHAMTAESWQEMDLPGGSPSDGRGRDFFDGLSLAPGGDARRAMMRPLNGLGEQNLEAARRQRNFANISRTMLDQSGPSDQLLAQLKEMNRGLTDAQAAMQLVTLAEEYRRRANWDAAEATLMELVTDYPAEPAAQGAIRWLLTLWSSEEMEWQRMRTLNVGGSLVRRNDDGTTQGVRQAGGAVRVGDLQSVLSAAGRAIDSDVPAGQAVGRRRLDGAKRATQASRLMELLRSAAPEEAAEADLQFPWAALLRRQDRHREADAIYQGFSRLPEGRWYRPGAGEMWLLDGRSTPVQAVHAVRQTSTPPILDGIFSDDCWEQCDELKLSSDPTAAGDAAASTERRGRLEIGRNDEGRAHAICMLSYDSRFLYLAASAPRHPRLPGDPPSYAGRPYDADLASFDHISLALDVNRDYASFYRLDVDQRGWTRDACWEDQSWNPRWHVAAVGDQRYWRIEAAIPWEELTPLPPAPGSAWALGVMRTMPGVGRQSWQWPASDDFQPRAFGLLKFE